MNQNQISFSSNQDYDQGFSPLSVPYLQQYKRITKQSVHWVVEHEVSCTKFKKQNPKNFTQIYNQIHQKALKVIDKTDKNFKKTEKKLLQETSIHSALKHHYIVSLLNNFEDQMNYYLLMDLCEGGDLYSYIKEHGKLDEPEIFDLSYQLAMGLKYLHDQNVIHRDLKLGNILLKENKKDLKICDFGLAARLTDDKPERDTLCGTPNYICPEIINKQNYGKKVDIWSFGCILYSMVTGSPPFETSSIQETLRSVKEGCIQIPTNTSSELQNLLQNTIQRESNLRFDVDDILNHDFFKKNRISLDHGQLENLKLEDLCDVETPSQRYNIYKNKSEVFKGQNGGAHTQSLAATQFAATQSFKVGTQSYYQATPPPSNKTQKPQIQNTPLNFLQENEGDSFFEQENKKTLNISYIYSIVDQKKSSIQSTESAFPPFRQPLTINTKGIRSTKLQIKNGTIEILDGMFILSLYDGKTKLEISPCGQKINIHKYSKKKMYTLQQMPSKYLKLYSYAVEVCNTLRVKLTKNQ